MILLLAAPLPAAAVPMLVLEVVGQGSDVVVGKGGVLSFQVRALDVPQGAPGAAGQVGMFGYGFSVLFDAVGFPAASTPVGSGPFPAGSATRNQPGEVGATANRFLTPGDGPSGDFVVAVFDLTAGDVAGVFDLVLTGFGHAADGSPVPGDNVLYDGTQLDAADGFFGGARVRVPEPSSAALLGAGLLAIVLAHRRP